MYNEFPKFKNEDNLYLYCVRERRANELNVTGIFNQEKVFSIVCKNLEAIVSIVPQNQFDDTDIKKKAREDINWIKEKAQLHEAIVEKAMYHSSEIYPVIPMRFGTIFKSKEKINHLLTKHYHQYSNTIARLTKKQEWSVKVYLTHQDRITDHVVSTNEFIKKEQADVAVLPKGMAYFMQKKLNEMVKNAVDDKMNQYVHDIIERLEKHSTGRHEGKLLGPEFTGKKATMVLNAILLIHEESVLDLIEAIQKLQDEMNVFGFRFEYSGPWPPYHFVESQ